MLRDPLRGRRRALVRIAAWSVVESAPALVGGLVVANAVDRGFARQAPLAGLGWLAMLALAWSVRVVAVRRLYPWLAAVVEPVRDSLVRAVVTATLVRAAAGERPDPAGAARLGSQVETVRRLVSGLLRTMRGAAVGMIAAAVGLTALAPAVAAVVLPPLALALVFYGLLLSSLARREYATLLAEEAVAASAGTALSGLRDVVACAARDRVAAEVGAEVDRFAATTRALARATAARTLVITVGGQGVLLALVVLAPWLTEHRLTAGQLVGGLTYVTASLLPAIRTLVTVVGDWLVELGIALYRLAEASRTPPAPPPSRAAPPAGHDLRIRGLTFAYGPHAAPVVDHLDLDLPEGRHLAIVGPSGMGKTTLARLLCGLDRPQSGAVLLGGVPVTAIAPDALRRRIVLSPQAAYVFAGTLRENLAYLRPGATDAQLDAAVRALGLGALVARLGGYDAVPYGLSSGERQLVALARAYFSEASVLVLDEATCHLDPATEARVETAFAERGRTLIVIAHRISSARRADLVLLMDGPRTVCGSHDDLLAGSSTYADLVGQWAVPTSDRSP
ncbi:ABC transporter [Couchioplanes caeruleus subsp. caeruleus]|uniref:ABC transporter n=1 Tax=Couchioplanes caeruleus subsp. caeruleus TaxID=56427 RepID=A0A1K0GXA1_9ACTN|nr:ABC transporter [Couchioplanes caeruleus subsp. caeruleus]